MQIDRKYQPIYAFIKQNKDLFPGFFTTIFRTMFTVYQKLEALIAGPT
jgi:hypothetical protein